MSTVTSLGIQILEAKYRKTSERLERGREASLVPSSAINATLFSISQVGK